MLLNKHNPKLNKQISIKEGKVNQGVITYLSVYDNYTPKSKEVAK